MIIPCNTHTHTQGVYAHTDFSEALDASGGILRAEWERVLDNEERVWTLRLLVISQTRMRINNKNVRTDSVIKIKHLLHFSFNMNTISKV